MATDPNTPLAGTISIVSFIALKTPIAASIDEIVRDLSLGLGDLVPAIVWGDRPESTTNEPRATAAISNWRLSSRVSYSELYQYVTERRVDLVVQPLWSNIEGCEGGVGLRPPYTVAKLVFNTCTLAITGGFREVA